MKPPSLFEIIERMNVLIRAEERKKCTDLGLQPVHLQVLQYLSSSNRFSDTPVALTNYLGRTLGTVSQSVTLLEKKGLIKKIPDQEDRRVVHLELTSKGKKMLGLALPAELFVKAASFLGEEENIQQYTAYFDSALQALQKAYDAKSFGVCKTCHYNTATDMGYVCSFHKERLSPEDVELLCQDHTMATWWQKKYVGYDRPTT